MTASETCGSSLSVFVSLSSFSSSALLIQTSRWKDTISTSPWSPTGTSIPTSPSEIIKVRKVYHLYALSVMGIMGLWPRAKNNNNNTNHYSHSFCWLNIFYSKLHHVARLTRHSPSRGVTSQLRRDT